MAVQIAERWFERSRIDDDITLLWEPHVHRLLRCNIWHMRGRDRDLLVDTGLGVASLAEAARDLFEKKLTAVATHTHLDHVGGMHEFAERIVHRTEGGRLAEGNRAVSLRPADRGQDYVDKILAAGIDVPEEYLSAYPHAGYDIRVYSVQPAPATRIVEEGDIIDLGDRHFEVMHLPGHSPGSIALWEAATGILFSGDVIYDGVLLDEIEGSNIPDYIATMRRLRELRSASCMAGTGQASDGSGSSSWSINIWRSVQVRSDERQGLSRSHSWRRATTFAVPLPLWERQGEGPYGRQAGKKHYESMIYRRDHPSPFPCCARAPSLSHKGRGKFCVAADISRAVA